jgi:hypothetical protein
VVFCALSLLSVRAPAINLGMVGTLAGQVAAQQAELDAAEEKAKTSTGTEQQTAIQTALGIQANIAASTSAIATVNANAGLDGVTQANAPATGSGPTVGTTDPFQVSLTMDPNAPGSPSTGSSTTGGETSSTSSTATSATGGETSPTAGATTEGDTVPSSDGSTTTTTPADRSLAGTTRSVTYPDAGTPILRNGSGVPGLPDTFNSSNTVVYAAWVRPGTDGTSWIDWNGATNNDVNYYRSQGFTVQTFSTAAGLQDLLANTPDGMNVVIAAHGNASSFANGIVTASNIGDIFSDVGGANSITIAACSFGQCTSGLSAAAEASGVPVSAYTNWVGTNSTFGPSTYYGNTSVVTAYPSDYGSSTPTAPTSPGTVYDPYNVYTGNIPPQLTTAYTNTTLTQPYQNSQGDWVYNGSDGNQWTVRGNWAYPGTSVPTTPYASTWNAVPPNPNVNSGGYQPGVAPIPNGVNVQPPQLWTPPPSSPIVPRTGGTYFAYNSPPESLTSPGGSSLTVTRPGSQILNLRSCRDNGGMMPCL